MMEDFQEDTQSSNTDEKLYINSNERKNMPTLNQSYI